MTRQLAVGRRHQRAGRRPRLDHAHGVAFHRIGRRHAARGLHDEKPAPVAAPAEGRPEPAQVRAHRGHHVGVHDRGGRALVLAERRRDLVRERHRDLGRLLRRQRGQPLLVLRVQVGVQETDRERRDAALGQRADRAARVHLVQRRTYRAVREHALGDLADESPPDEGARLLELEIVDLVALLAPDEQHVAEAARGQQADPAGLALDDDVAAERRAVHGLGDVAPGHARARQQRVEAGQARLGGIGIGGEALGGGQLAGGRLQHEVRERAAHVEADPVRHEVSSAAPRARARRDTDSAGPSDR